MIATIIACKLIFIILAVWLYESSHVMIMEGIQGPPVAEREQLTFSQRCWAVDAVMLAYSCIRWNGWVKEVTQAKATDDYY